MSIAAHIRRALRTLWRRLLRPNRVRHEGVLLSTRGLPRVVRNAIYSGRYELAEAKHVADILKPGDIVLELGTGLGFLSTRLCQLGAGAVHTFDPNPQLRERIAETFRLNGVAPNFTSCILGPDDGMERFGLGEIFWTSSTVASNHHIGEIEVPVRSFNAFVTTIKPNLLVCDIEGGERALFEYADLSSFDRIVIELHPTMIGNAETVAVIERLRELGFTPDIATVMGTIWRFSR